MREEKKRQGWEDEGKQLEEESSERLGRLEWRSEVPFKTKVSSEEFIFIFVYRRSALASDVASSPLETFPVFVCCALRVPLAAHLFLNSPQAAASVLATAQEDAEDLPGGARFPCLTCGRFFFGEEALQRHKKSKTHKRRTAAAGEAPWTAEASELAGR